MPSLSRIRLKEGQAAEKDVPEACVLEREGEMRPMSVRRLFIPVMILALGACEGSGGAASPDVVAEAAGAEFTAQEAAEILVPQTELPNQPQVVDALANLWVDYFLLARVAAVDTTLNNMDVGPLVEQNVNQELVLRLRDQVIQVDTAISDEELQDHFERDLPGARVRARHILLRFPQDATPAQADSVRALADSLRNRLLGGEDFATLAREYSEDAGSAPNGGDLGSFGKGEMVPPLEEAAFSLDVGEISPVVETTFGLHIIRVDERIVPPLEGSEEQFRTQLQNRRVAEAESTYVAGLMDAADLQVQESEYETVRQLAQTPNMALNRRARDRSIVKFAGGSLTLGDLQDWILSRSGPYRGQIRDANDQQLNAFLRDLTRERLLIRAARVEGIQVSQARRDSVSSAIRSSVREVARQLGILHIQPREGQSMDQAADSVVLDVLRQIVGGQREVIPMGGVSFILRKQFPSQINPAGLDRTVSLIGELRTRPSTPPAPAMPAPEPDTTAPDTGGGEG
jgi:peptidyl-prolyl cis-trans isomerase C